MNKIELITDISFDQSDLDCRDKVTIKSIFEACQDIATKHANILHIGFEDFITKNYIWVISKFRYTLINDIPSEVNLKIRTWPHKSNSIEFIREFEIYDENKVYLTAISRWCIIDYKTRRLVRARDINLPAEGYDEKTNFPTPYHQLGALKKEEMTFAFDHLVNFSDLDHNRHMNNTNYATLVVNSIPDMVNKEIVDCQIHFVKESVYQEKISIYFKEEENTYIIQGIKNDDSIAFEAHVITKEIQNG